MKKNIPKEVKWLFQRNAIQDFTSLDLLAKIIKEKGKAYVGFDLTKPSLQLGNMVCLNIGEILVEKGIEVSVVLGGATTLVGDPAGKTSERLLSQAKIVKNNLNHIQDFLKTHYPKLKVLNNNSWWQEISTIDFLRLCKSISVNYLLDRQLIRERLENKGISFTEFSYTLVQGLDFYFLAKKKGITLQYGGSDQWGNLLTGHDIINKETNIPTTCFSIPLLVDNQQRKMGKTEDNALYLDEKEFSSYALYQAIFNFPDSIMREALLKLTIWSQAKIATIMNKHNLNKSKRIAQIALAKYIIEKNHSEKAFHNSQRVSEIIFKKDFDKLTKSDLLLLIKSPLYRGLLSKNEQIETVLVKINYAKSLSDARRLIHARGVRINLQLIDLPNSHLKDYLPFFGSYYIISKGKKDISLINSK